MKKKILASILATLSAAVCLTALPANAITTKNHYTKYSQDISFSDSADNYSTSVSYDAKISTWCYYYANVTLTSKNGSVNSYGYISTKDASSNAWKYVKEGTGKISKNSIKMTKSWQYETLISTIDFETGSLCSRLNVKNYTC